VLLGRETMTQNTRQLIGVALAAFVIGFPLLFALAAQLNLANFHSGEGLFTTFIADALLSLLLCVVASRSAGALKWVTVLVLAVAAALLIQMIVMTLGR
jgi:hypothetical protein